MDKLEVEENDLVITNEPRLLLTANSYRHKAVYFWKNLPLEIRTEKKFGRFKTTVKRWLLDRRDPDPDPDPSDPDPDSEERPGPLSQEAED